MIFRKLVYLLVMFTSYPESLQETCVEKISSVVDVTVTSRRNSTGHLLTKLEMMQAAGGDVGGDMIPWTVSLRQEERDCGEQKSKFLQTTIAVPPQLALDYEFYPLVGRYKFHTTPKTWFQAFTICEQEGGHLAVINSEAEAQLLVSMFQRGPKIEHASFDYVAFIGVSDIVKEGTFVTIFGEDLSTTGFSAWSNGEPNNSGGSPTHPGQDCVAILKGKPEMDDVNCDAQLAFFCEQELR